MTHEAAVQLIRQGVPQSGGPQEWADLGCGRGMFTFALASLLERGSIVHAIDKDESELRLIAKTSDRSTIDTLCLDFVRDPIPMKLLNGVLMGNALHYVKESLLFLTRLKNHLRGDGCLLVIEYEVDKANPWIPYPVPFRRLESLAIQAGFPTCTRLTSVPSQLREAQLYSVLMSQQATNPV